MLNQQRTSNFAISQKIPKTRKRSSQTLASLNEMRDRKIYVELGC